MRGVYYLMSIEYGRDMQSDCDVVDYGFMTKNKDEILNKFIERLKYELNFDDFILEDGKTTLEEVKSNLIEWFKTNDKSFIVDFYRSKHDYDSGNSAFTYKIYKIEERW